MKQCSTCKAMKDKACFAFSSYSKSGLRSQCKQCEKEYRDTHKEQHTAWVEANIDTIREKRKAYKSANALKLKSKNKEYRERNKEQRYTYNTKWNSDNRLHKQDYDKKYKQINKGTINNINAKRRATKLERTPMWVTDVGYQYIKALYKLADLQTKLTGEKWHVDHQIPLLGKLVSGLHVPMNMRIIKASDNLKKGNRYGI